MSESPRKPGNQDQSPPLGDGLEPLFLGADAPPLEGEEPCICGQLEGEHRTDGSCPASGCLHFVSENDVEEPTDPEIRVEYDAGVAPLGGAR